MNDFVDYFANDFIEIIYDFVSGNFAPLSLAIRKSINSALTISIK
jgi:hypothetical protein